MQTTVENDDAFFIHLRLVYYVCDFFQDARRIKIAIVSLIFLDLHRLQHVINPVVGDVTHSEYFGAQRREIDRVVESQSE